MLVSFGLYFILAVVVIYQAFLLKELAIEVRKLAKELHELRR
jgi:hypothetical protein